MDARGAKRIEAIVDVTAAAIAAAAVGYATLRLGWPVAAAVGAGVGSLLAAARLLRSIEPVPAGFAIAPFAVSPLPEPEDELLLTEVTELLLTEEDRLDVQVLALEDIRANVEQNSRVVRLFDPAAMPTPGELNEKIERHLGGPSAACADASQALHDALAELRRSLR
ncbi:MAG TPA: hypothetical protein VF079_06065 [Sphingomicrobium sp.]